MTLLVRVLVEVKLDAAETAEADEDEDDDEDDDQDADDDEESKNEDDQKSIVFELDVEFHWSFVPMLCLSNAFSMADATDSAISLGSSPTKTLTDCWYVART